MPVELLFIPQEPGKKTPSSRESSLHLSQKEFIFFLCFIVFYIVISFGGHPLFTLSCVIALCVCPPSPSRHLTPAPLGAMCPVLGTSFEFRKYMVTRALVLLLLLLLPWPCFWEWFPVSQKKALGKARPEDSPTHGSQWLSFSKHGGMYLHTRRGRPPSSAIAQGPGWAN